MRQKIRESIRIESVWYIGKPGHSCFNFCLQIEFRYSYMKIGNHFYLLRLHCEMKGSSLKAYFPLSCCFLNKSNSFQFIYLFSPLWSPLQQLPLSLPRNDMMPGCGGGSLPPGLHIRAARQRWVPVLPHSCQDICSMHFHTWKPAAKGFVYTHYPKINAGSSNMQSLCTYHITACRCSVLRSPSCAVKSN